jgi:hypothetical protein
MGINIKLSTGKEIDLTLEELKEFYTYIVPEYEKNMNNWKC